LKLHKEVEIFCDVAF